MRDATALAQALGTCLSPGVFYCPFTLSLNFPEHLNLTTFLGSNIIASPVFGFVKFLLRIFPVRSQSG